MHQFLEILCCRLVAGDLDAHKDHKDSAIIVYR